MLVNRSVTHKQIPRVYSCHGKLEVCAIEVALRSDLLVLMVCYRPLSLDTIIEFEWSRFLSQFGHRKVFFGGNFNCHHVDWGSLHTYITRENDHYPVGRPPGLVSASQ